MIVDEGAMVYGDRAATAKTTLQKYINSFNNTPIRRLSHFPRIVHAGISVITTSFVCVFLDAPRATLADPKNMLFCGLG